VAYATVYAAYALYGFLGPAIAFVLLEDGSRLRACCHPSRRAPAARSSG